MGEVEKGDFSIKPENVATPINYADFPLLLKNYDKRIVPLCQPPTPTH